MGPLGFLSRLVFGLPTVDSLELIEAKTYSPPNCLARGGLSGDYDLAYRPLVSSPEGVVSPEVRPEDCMSSSELEEAARDIYQRFCPPAPL